jgi:diguanylate cyclase (GGDEF)-like protein/PAS domain S-box-containing protein
MQRQRFFTRIATGFGLASAILIIIGVVSYRSLTQLVEASNQAAQTQKVLAKLEDLVSKMKDAETGQRGYLLTGDEDYLEPYRAAVSVVDQEVKELRKLTADNSIHQQQINTLESLMAKKLAELKQTIDLRSSKGYQAALQVVLTNKGKNFMDEIRQIAREIENEEERLLIQRSQRAQASINKTIFSFSSGLVVTFVILAGVYYCIYREITERKRSEEELREMSAALENAVDGIARLDKQGHYLKVNRAYASLAGYQPEEMVGMEWQRTVHPEELDRARVVYQQMLTNGKGEAEIRGVHKDGSIFYQQVVLVTAYDQQHEAIGYHCFAKDITLRKQVEEALHDSEERFRQLSDATFEAIAISEEGRIIEANRNFAQMFGYQASAVNGMSAMDVTALEDRERVKQIIVLGSEAPYEAACLRKDGTVFPGEIRGKALPYQGRTVTVTAIRDITQRKQAESALSQANEKLTGWVNELEQRNREIVMLSEMSDILQACISLEEAYNAIAILIQPLFPEISGGLFIINASTNLVEAVATWGTALASQTLFSPSDCWGLRRSRLHRVEDVQQGLLCKHFHETISTAQSLCIPMIAQGEALGLLYLSASSQGQLNQGKHRLAVTVTEQISLALANLKLRESLRNQSIRDPLTGLFNRRYLEESLEREVNRAERKQQSLGVIMLDVDHFKRFNDTFGHEAGDVVLREVGMFLKRNVRLSDIACRYGGEELTLILPETTLEVTLERAEKIREGVKHLNLQHRRQALGAITLSLGVACFPEHGTTGEAVIQAADAALYCAKKEGRDRCCTASGANA